MTETTKPAAPAPSTPGRERRRFTRVALDAHVAVAFPDQGELFHSRVRDLSENGVFIVTAKTRAIGTNIRVSISVEEGGLQIDARGIVVHEVERSSPGRPAGIGVMFTEVSEPTLALLRQLVASRPPLP